MKYLILVGWLVLETGLTAQDTASTKADGTWRWEFRMPDGTEVQPKLKLKQEGERLTGVSSHRGGPEIAITNGVFVGSVVRFDVVRERNGARAVTHYEGTLEGNLIRGTVESDWNWTGERQRYEWQAKRASGIEGRWKWKAKFGGREFDVTVSLKLEGDKLSGTLLGAGRGFRDTAIKEASFQDGTVKFTVERGRDNFRSVQVFEGKLEGDTIKGKIETERDGEETESDWDAKRAD